MRSILRRFSVILTVLAVVLLLPGPLASATDTVGCLTLDKSIVLIGDSNTVMLSTSCQEIRQATVIARIGAGIGECIRPYSGKYAFGTTKTMKACIDALNGAAFHTVVVNMGTNNLGSSITAYKADYGTLLSRLLEKNPSATIYLCKILPINQSTYHGPYPSVVTNANVAIINNAVTELQADYAARGFDVRLIDMNTPFRDQSGSLSAVYNRGDGLHLNSAGYGKMNEVLQHTLAVGDLSLPHQWGPSEHEDPTCTEGGYTRVVCQVCGAEQLTAFPATGHQWEDEQIVTQVTCTEDGASFHRCAGCGLEETVVLPALGHDWNIAEVLQPPTEESHGFAAYCCGRCGETKQAELCCSERFIDAPKRGNWAHNAVDWAVFHGITKGTTKTTFTPDAACTRAQAVTFLWRMQEKPGAEGTLPFSDVNRDRYYFHAVIWALSNGITKGTTKTTFAPDAACTRAQIVTFLWRTAGSPMNWETGEDYDDTEKPGDSSDSPAFEDVPAGAYYAKAVNWAAANGITQGTGPNTFAPDAACTRAQIVTFLARYAQRFPNPKNPEAQPQPPEPENPYPPEP